MNYKTPHYAIECIRSLVQERVAIPGLEVVLIDNASGDGSPDIMAISLADLVEDGFVKLMPLGLNGGFGWANNQALLTLMARANPPEFVMLLNPDCTIEPHAVSILRDELLAYESCVVAGSQLLNPDGSCAGSAFRFPTVGRELIRGSGIALLGRLLRIAPTLITSDEPCEADWVTGASCLLRTSALFDHGLFDDGFFLYFEEVELMFRLRASGRTVRHVPDSRVHHVGGASTGLGEGKSLSRQTYPLYWFQSRRRFFTRAYGPIRAWLAGIAWITGSAVRRVLAAIEPARADPSALGNLRHMLAHGLRASSGDRSNFIARAGDLPGKPPRWTAITDDKTYAA